MATPGPASRDPQTPGIQRGRGRGRPRKETPLPTNPDGTIRRKQPNQYTPKDQLKSAQTPARKAAIAATAAAAAFTTPRGPVPPGGTSRRRLPLGVGYRPGGAGGGGRYIHPTTGAEIPASIYRDFIRKGETDLEKIFKDGSVPPMAYRKETMLVTPAPRFSAQSSYPLPAALVGSDGVYKPREERSYTEFHPNFDPERLLRTYSAEEIDGANYKPPGLDGQKNVKIVDIKEEQSRDTPEGGETMSRSGSATKSIPFPASPSINSQAAGTPRMDVDEPPLPKPTTSYPRPMDGVESTANLAALTPPPPPSVDFSLNPIDSAQNHDTIEVQAQTQTPAATPTDLTLTELAPPHPTTPNAQDAGSPRKGIIDTPTLASLRAHRSNAGKPAPRLPPPTSARRGASRQQNNPNGDEKLHLREPSFRLIQPYKFSDVAWNGEIGTTGGYSLNDPTSGEKLSERMISVGYQRNTKFIRPPTLLRDYPDRTVDEELGNLETDLVEYDMDEQDEKWLTAYNNNRTLSDHPPVSRELFELVMTKVEKEWVNLERRIPKPTAKPSSGSNRRRSRGGTAEDDDEDSGEDSKCAICDDGECENANAIVFCDGCNLAVHQECYGVPYIPEGQWHCRKCQQIPRQSAVSFKFSSGLRKWLMR